jgi:hypothetical protein
MLDTLLVAGPGTDDRSAFFNSCSCLCRTRPRHENGRPGTGNVLPVWLPGAIFRPGWVVCETPGSRQLWAFTLVNNHDSYRLCFVRVPEGIIVGLAEQLS